MAVFEDLTFLSLSGKRLWKFHLENVGGNRGPGEGGSTGTTPAVGTSLETADWEEITARRV